VSDDLALVGALPEDGAEPLLRCEHVTVCGSPSQVEIISGIDLSVDRGTILGLVGESGSGKTTLGLALLAHAKRATRITSGSIRIGPEELLNRPDRDVRRLRGRAVAYIPQSPASALNPALRLGLQLREALYATSTTNGTVQERVREVLREVALPDDDAFLQRYPHQLSGGR
jgi:peptide/nickel transport system ATP-binding protein